MSSHMLQCLHSLMLPELLPFVIGQNREHFSNDKTHHLPEQIILDNREEGPYPVLPRDLLSLRVASPVIGDRDFVDPVSLPCHLCRDLRLKPEPVRFYRNLFKYPPRKNLVARFHVGKVQVAKNI